MELGRTAPAAPKGPLAVPSVLRVSARRIVSGGVPYCSAIDATVAASRAIASIPLPARPGTLMKISATGFEEADTCRIPVPAKFKVDQLMCPALRQALSHPGWRGGHAPPLSLLRCPELSKVPPSVEGAS